MKLARYKLAAAGLLVANIAFAQNRGIDSATQAKVLRYFGSKLDGTKGKENKIVVPVNSHKENKQATTSSHTVSADTSKNKKKQEHNTPKQVSTGV